MLISFWPQFHFKSPRRISGRPGKHNKRATSNNNSWSDHYINQNRNTNINLDISNLRLCQWHGHFTPNHQLQQLNCFSNQSNQIDMVLTAPALDGRFTPAKTRQNPHTIHILYSVPCPDRLPHAARSLHPQRNPEVQWRQAPNNHTRQQTTPRIGHKSGLWTRHQIQARLRAVGLKRP